MDPHYPVYMVVMNILQLQVCISVLHQFSLHICTFFSDFISLELERGYPRLLIDFGSGTLELKVKTKKTLDDGEWHRIDIFWDTEVILKINFPLLRYYPVDRQYILVVLVSSNRAPSFSVCSEPLKVL